MSCSAHRPCTVSLRRRAELIRTKMRCWVRRRLAEKHVIIFVPGAHALSVDRPPLPPASRRRKSCESCRGSEDRFEESRAVRQSPTSPPAPFPIISQNSTWNPRSDLASRAHTNPWSRARQGLIVLKNYFRQQPGGAASDRGKQTSTATQGAYTPRLNGRQDHACKHVPPNIALLLVGHPWGLSARPAAGCDQTCRIQRKRAPHILQWRGECGNHVSLRCFSCCRSLWQVCAQDCGLRRQRVPNSAPNPDRAALPAEELEEVEYAPTITLLTPSPGEVVLPAARSATPTWKPTRTLTFSPQVVRGVVELSWEVLFFDMAQGFVQAEIDGETVETPLPFDPETGLPLGPDAERLRLDARFGSGQPLQDGPHQARLTLYSLLGLEIAATAANFSVNASPARDPPSLSPRGTEPVTRPPLCLPREVPRARAAVSRARS